MFLNLCNCSSLTQIHGLECLTALEDINLSGVTSLSDCVSIVQSGHNRALHNCCLSGSKIAVAYNNRWLERKPALQLISYYDDYIGYFPNGMLRECVRRRNAFDIVLETTISTEAECVALIFCFVAHDQGWGGGSMDNGYYRSHCGMEVKTIRKGKVVSETGLLNLRHVDGRSQVYLWTLRREHPVVQSLQIGDRICVYARSRYPGRAITRLEGAICVVHAKDDHLTLEINSELLSRSDSEEFANKLGQLVLADKSHLSLKSDNGEYETELDKGEYKMESDNGEHDMELVADEIDRELGSTYGDLLAINEDSDKELHPSNPDLTYEILQQQEWLIAPAYGHYHWTHSWKLPREGQGIISFEARGSSVHVAISEFCNSPLRRKYEIIIGGWGNSHCDTKLYCVTN